RRGPGRAVSRAPAGRPRAGVGHGLEHVRHAGRRAHAARASRLGRAPGPPLAPAHAGPGAARRRVRGCAGTRPPDREHRARPGELRRRADAVHRRLRARPRGRQPGGRRRVGGRAAGARRPGRVLLRGHAVLLHRAEALVARRLSRLMSEPREPIRTEVHRVADPDATRVASYLAQPGEVGRVLLLYSGGLDTSVMLKWIQDEYEAEVVALTVNLGQPGEDYDVVRGKALQLGAIECYVVDAREEFANDYVLPAIKANALYGGGYPLFTALGRPLIAELAVGHARESGCDTIAHGCTGKGNDQVRIEATVATLAPELRTIAPVRSWQMGREEEIAYAREHGIPVKGGTEVTPYSI